MRPCDCLIPQPASLSLTGDGVLAATGSAFVLLGHSEERLKRVLSAFEGDHTTAVHVSIAADMAGGAESYRLTIDANGVTITAGSTRGLFYGLHTLRQLVLLYDSEPIPALAIEDRPQFAVRGLHLDLRCQKLRPEYLGRYVAELASYKINTVTFEWEDTFPFLRHPVVSGPYHYTREEVRAVLAACEENFITAVPLLQTIGHVEYILRHERYASLRESHNDFSQFCLCNEEVMPLLRDLIDEMADMHGGPFFHMGGDETRLLGACAVCAASVARSSKAELYADHAARVASYISSRGKKPVLWADIATHYPEMLSRLPADIVFQDWRYSYAPGMVYETLPLFRRHGLRFHAAGCGRGMSDSEWHYEYERIFGNLRQLSLQGKAAGAEGFFSTSWSTNGVMDVLRTREGEVVAGYYRLHRYPIPGNILPVLACAEHAWNAGACDTETLLRRVPPLLFGLDQPRIIEGIMDGTYEVFFLGHCRENARRCRRGYETLRSLEPLIRRNHETYRHLVFMARGHAHMALRKALFHEADAVWGRDPDAFRALEPELRELFEQRDALQRRHRELFAPLFDPDELQAEHAALFTFEQEAQRRYERPF